jgi:hypothetical protein
MQRFIHIYNFLKENEGVYRYVVSTDVRDVIFQSDPTIYLDSIIGAQFATGLVASSEAIKIKVREYASKNQEAIKIKRLEYYQKNKLKWSTYQIERAAVDPVYKMKVSIRKLLVKVMSGSKTQRCEEILGCSYSELHNHIESQFEPWMTWENKGKYSGTLNYGWDVDHIIPLCTAKTVEDIIRLNHYTNLRPLCSHVNRNIKRGKYE